MTRRQIIVSVFIIFMVGTIAAWSKLRHVGKESYDAPARWKADEHPSLQRHNADAG